MEKAQNIALRDALNENFKKANNVFLLLLDDIDQVASTQNKHHLNRIWGFLLAAKKLTEELPNMKTIISLRTEIWTLIERDEAGQRDQIDHIRQLLKRLDPSDEVLKEIILRRLKVVASQCGSSTDNSTVFRLFYDSPMVLLPTSKDEKRYWEDFIAKSSRGRPRDAIQFLGILANEALSKGHSRITQDVVDSAASKYSAQRVNDLTREYSNDCSVVRELLNTFTLDDFIVPTEVMKDHISKIPTKFGVQIRGKTIHPDDTNELFGLWRFLHEIGLLNPRIPDKREPKEYRHISYDENPNFISFSNWSEMQKVAWEIHPAYRSYLIEKKLDDRARSGISLTSFFKNK
jgi:hypothetical protein